MKLRAGLVAMLAAWLLAFPFAGCGGNDLVVGGSLPLPTITAASVTPTPCSPLFPCFPAGSGCTTNLDCCSCSCSFNACQ